MAVTLSVRLGRCLASLREERGWSQAYLAEISGVGRSHLSQIENGAVSVRVDTLEALAKSLAVTLVSLFERL